MNKTLINRFEQYQAAQQALFMSLVNALVTEPEPIADAGPGQPVGRRLDFLMQEFGREANTIGSKGNDSPIAHHVVDLKTEIERIREQVQNVE